MKVYRMKIFLPQVIILLAGKDGVRAIKKSDLNGLPFKVLNEKNSYLGKLKNSKYTLSVEIKLVILDTRRIKRGETLPPESIEKARIMNPNYNGALMSADAVIITTRIKDLVHYVTLKDYLKVFMKPADVSNLIATLCQEIA